MAVGQNQYKSVWDALEVDPIQAKNLKLRSALMIGINEYCSSAAISTEEVIGRLCIDSGRVVDLQRGLVNKFNLDELVDAAHRLGLKVSMEVA